MSLYFYYHLACVTQNHWHQKSGSSRSSRNSCGSTSPNYTFQIFQYNLLPISLYPVPNEQYRIRRPELSLLSQFIGIEV